MQGFPLPPIEPSVPHGPNIEHPLLPIMTSERILGALLWSVWHYELSADLVHLVDTLTKEYRIHLERTEEFLGILLGMTWGCNMDTRVREGLISTLRGEIEGTIRYQQYTFEEMMKPDRVLGALLWTVWHNQLPDELIEMVKALPEEWEHSDLGDLVKILVAEDAPKSKKAKRQLVERLRNEIERLLEAE
jgi:hypothetical protein